MHFWVVGTDTDVGKTVVTTLLMRQLQQEHLQVIPYKPVQTGEIYGNGHSYYEDTAMYQKYSLQKLKEAHLNSYSLKEAASPHFAAQLESQQIEVDKLLQHIEELQQSYDVVICEGAGGLFVPLDSEKQLTLLEVIVHSQLPVVVVTRTSLGTINHTLLTMEALQARQIEVLGIAFNGCTGSRLEQDNIKTILTYHPIPYAIIPPLQNHAQLGAYSIKATSLFERLYVYESTIH
ncbi:dethiobiotin synthase [Lysinibacillus macroides]|uniref:ATP-dependent dethiobiotin synthetase BioD n=1 Tax=Lysinibacillus macroides TaxID=33935 RepID=A0A0M9DM72_9BACI|nr:dethiobiotin synthase [Lysinibacillus macroides]KOY83266.1 ATP-dependent dethiobiotin synthetase BioD [Lysinibacillus macroides]QPR69129.1 dethiobiotin synthase [Lysinibacillus macroides]